MLIEDSFLQAVREAPDDDVPRLICADWLDEHGNPERAEFIRAQCRLAKGGIDSTERRTLQLRTQQLLGLHEETWAGPLLDIVRKVHFRRGFIESVTLPAMDLIEHGERLFTLAPVREAIVVQAGPSIDQLAACPQLAHLRLLDFRDSNGGLGAGPTLLKSPHLAQLKGLVARFSQIGSSLAKGFAEVRQPPALETLDLYDASLSLEAIEALVYSPHAASLRQLILGGSDLGEGSTVSLARSPHLGGLATLHLAFAGLGEEDALALANAPGLQGLRRLDLGGNAIGTRGARALVASPHFRHLEVLNLKGAGLKGKPANALRKAFGDRVIL